MNINVALKVSYILKLAYRVIYLMYKLFFFFMYSSASKLCGRNLPLSLLKAQTEPQDNFQEVKLDT